MELNFGNFRKAYVNPYRSGVKIGNYNEDLFGKELAEKEKKINYDRPNTARNYISESMDRYRWPVVEQRYLKPPGNQLTQTQTSNFDMNIVFNKQNFDDYMKVYQRNEENPFILEDKNKFSKDEANVEQNINKYNKSITRRPQSANPNSTKLPKPKTFYSNGPFQDANEEIIDETQKLLSKSHVTDARGLFNVGESGINNYLLMGHGCQKRFQKTDYASMYDLTMSRKERTDRVLDPHYKIIGDFYPYEKASPDFTDWGFRKYKIRGEFTNKFDKGTNKKPYW